MTKPISKHQDEQIATAFAAAVAAAASSLQSKGGKRIVDRSDPERVTFQQTVRNDTLAITITATAKRR
jgi:hypothetical protein